MSDGLERGTSDGMPDDDRLRELYRSLPAVEPRAELDDEILAAARLGAAPVNKPRSVVRRLRWAVPVAMAAGVVLTLTLTRLTPEQRATGVPVGENDSGIQERPAVSPSIDVIADDAATPQRSAEAKREVAAPSLPADKRKDEAASARGNSGLLRGRDESAAAASMAPAAEKPAQPPAELAAPVVQLAPPATPSPAAPPVAPAESAAADAAPEPGAAGGGPDMRPFDLTIPAPDGLPFARLGQATRPKDAPRSARLGASTRPKDDAWVPPAPAPWPFGLESGLSAGEACRRVTEAVKQPCTLRGSTADVSVDAGAVVDRGAYAGRSATHIRLLAEGDIIIGVELRLRTDDGGTESVQIRTLLR